MQLSRNAEQITVVAEDHYGNIIKKKILVADLCKKAEQTKDLGKEVKLQDCGEAPMGKNEQRIQNVGEKEIKSKTKNTTTVKNYKEEEKEGEINISPIFSKSSLSGEREGEVTTESQIPKDNNVSNSTKLQELQSKLEEEKELLKSIVKHQTTTSNFKEMRVNDILPLDDTIHCNKRLLNGSKDSSGKTDCDDMITKDLKQKPKFNEDKSYISKLTQEYQQELRDETEQSMTVGDETATCNKGQHVRQETTREHVQGNMSNGMNVDKIRTDYPERESVHANGQDGEIKSAVDSTLPQFIAASEQRSTSIRTETDRDTGGIISPVSENTVDDPPALVVSETDEDLMKNSAESNDSEKMDSLDRMQALEMDNQADNFDRNEQHNMAVQQTVESNQDGNEMVESFHMENGNMNL